MKFFKKRKTAVVVDTNVPLYYAGKMKEEGVLKKLKGLVFIPWVVMGELMTFHWIAEHEKKVKKEGTKEEKEELEKRLSELSDGKKTRRNDRGNKALVACPFVQERIDEGEWKTIGSYKELEPYLENPNPDIKNEIGTSDMKIIASCFLLKDKKKFKKVILLTRDVGLGEMARKFGIRWENGLSNLVR